LKLTKDLIKALHIFIKVFGEGEGRRMKGYSTRKMIDYSQTRREKGLKYLVIFERHSLMALIGLLSFAYCFVVRLNIKNLWERWFLA